MSEKIAEIKNLSVVYETDEATVHAINNLNLEIFAGETLGLVGETGAGKTTTALSVLKLLPEKVGIITDGEIILDGIDVINASEEKMRSIRGEVASMIFQDPMTSLNPILTVGDQIHEVLDLHRKKMSRAEKEKRVDEILTLVGISPDRKREYPHQFSGGMKQRIVIAIALTCEPKLLLADEPTTALDVTIQAQVLEIMKDLKEKLNTAMLLITHDVGVVAETCDRVAIMYAGEIIELGDVVEIFEGKYSHPYTKGLFGSIPDLTKKTKRLNPIRGLMPDPTNLPSGCKFHPRCPIKLDICETVVPVDKIVEGTHMIKCHNYKATVANFEPESEERK